MDKGCHPLSNLERVIFKVATGFKCFFSTMDIGQTRTGADVLAIDGVENYKLVAKTLTLFINSSRFNW
jgi:hypothetical protein